MSLISLPKIPRWMLGESSSDPYQDRYRAHQARKREVLAGLLAERHSDRVFADTPVPADLLADLLAAVERAPSSCDRRGVTATVVEDRDRKALLGGLLVGGVGWIHRAPAVLLLHADWAAYKAGDEVSWMPFLDAGAVVGQLGLVAAASGLAGCFVNPNVREFNRAHFADVFGPGLFCGAYAVGLPRVVTPDWVLETS